MCVLFIAIGQHPDYPLILLANRDEYLDRPTLHLDFWGDNESILGGRDIQAGGSWLAISRQGKIAAITNLRTTGTTNPSLRSRGQLINQYLNTSATQHSFEQFLRSQKDSYNPFNLLYGDIGQLHVFNSLQQSIQALDLGFHSISNSAINDIWPKMSRGVLMLRDLISRGRTLQVDQLPQIMQDETMAEDELLPNTGISLEKERRLSSIFIRGEQYGTRSTSIILYDGSQIAFHEFSHYPDRNTQQQQININPE